MKMTAKSPRFLYLLLAVLTITLSGCSDWKQSLFEMALDHERGKANLSEKTILVDKLPIRVLATPMDTSKETMVLLHGFAANKENWVRYAAHVKDQFNVVAIDLPGHGESVKDFTLNYSIANQVKYLHSIISKLGLSRFHLAGNSMGGAITSVYAATYQEQVITAVLFNPAGVYDHESELAKRLRKGENPLIVEKTEDFERLMDFGLEEKPFIPWPLTDILTERAIANKEINHKIFSDINNTKDDSAYKAALAQIKAPTLILWGVEDRVINVDNAAVFEQLIPNAKKIIFERIGHAPMIEIPEQSAELVKAFISDSHS